MATDNLVVVRRSVEQAWNKGAYEVLDETISASLVAHDPLFGEYRGPAGEKKHIMMIRSAFPDFNLKIEDIGTTGEKVYMRWTATGTHRGNLAGLAPTQRRAVVPGVSLFRMENGKIAESWQSWDTHGFLTNLGLAQTLDQIARVQPRAGANP